MPREQSLRITVERRAPDHAGTPSMESGCPRSPTTRATWARRAPRSSASGLRRPSGGTMHNRHAPPGTKRWLGLAASLWYLISTVVVHGLLCNTRQACAATFARARRFQQGGANAGPRRCVAKTKRKELSPLLVRHRTFNSITINSDTTPGELRGICR